MKKFRKVLIAILLVTISLIVFLILSNRRIIYTSVDNHIFIAKGDIPRGYDLKVDKIDDSTYDIRIENSDGDEWQPCDYGKEVEMTITDCDSYVKHGDNFLPVKRDVGNISFTTDHFSHYALVSLDYGSNSSKFKLLPGGSNAYYYFDDSTGTLWFHGKTGAYVSKSSETGNLSQVINLSLVKEICFTNDSSKIQLRNTMVEYFADLTNMTYFDASLFDLSQATNMFGLFKNCKSLEEVDLSSWNVSKTVGVHYLFEECNAIKKINLDGWTLTNCNSVYGIFYNCNSLEEIIGHWTFTDKVQRTIVMFYNCNSLKSVDTSGFNLSGCTDADNMFNGANKIREISTANWGNLSKVTRAFNMFRDCYSLETLDTSSWTLASCNTIDYMFYNCNSLGTLDVSKFTTRVSKLNGVFAYCKSVKTLDLASFNSSNVTEMQKTFMNCESLTSLNVNRLNVSKVTHFINCFQNCSSIAKIDISNWNMTNAKYLSYFMSGSGITSVVAPNSINQNEIDMTSCFQDCKNLTDISDLDSIKINTSSPHQIFKGCVAFTEIDTSKWLNYIGDNTAEWFYGCTNLRKITTAGVKGPKRAMADYENHRWAHVDDLSNDRTFLFDYSEGSSILPGTYVWSYDYTYEMWPKDTKGRWNKETRHSYFGYGDTATDKITDKTREGFTFKGWYADSACNTPYNHGEQVYADKTIYADWNPVPCTVTFDSQGGTSVESQTVNWWSQATKPAINPTKRGYVFSHWSKTVGGSEYNFASDIRGNTTLYAVWVKSNIEVTFDANGGKFPDGTTKAYLNVLNDYPVEKYSKDPTRNYYSFVGWSTSNTSYAAYDFSTKLKANKILYAWWKGNEYKITYENVPSGYATSRTYTYPNVTVAPTNPTKDGYTFSHWTVKGTTTKFTFGSALNENKTLVANWNEWKGTVVYNFLVRGKDGTTSSKAITYTGKIENVARGEKEGFTPTGWFYDKACTKAVDFTAASKISNGGTINVYCNYVENQTNLTWHYNDKNKADETKTYHYHDKITPMQHIREGYTFGGWYTDSACKNAFDFSKSVKATSALYAKWTENKGTLTFNTNGGSAVASQTINYWSKPTKPADPTKEGFTFGGWYTSQTFATSFDFTQPIKNGATAYAKWTENSSTLVFDSNGGTTVSSQTLNYWTNTTEPTKPKKEGYTFSGWYTDNTTFKTKFVFGQPIKTGGTVYAKWTENKGTLTFNTNGGSAVASQTINYWSKPTKPADPTKEGFTFGGWYTSQEFTTEFDFTKPIKTGKTAFAKWTENSGTLVFNTNRGSTVASQTLNYWGKPTKPANPTKEGYTFSGWYTSQTFATKFDFSQPIKNGATVYAKWEENSSSLVFNSNGGTAVTTQNLKYWSNTTEPADPQKEGFTFGGWYTDNSTFNNKFTFGNPVKLGGTVYAKWTENTGVMSFNTNGGSAVASQTLKYWANPTEPADPTKEGFTFTGWYISQTSTTKFDFTKPIKTGKTAFAKWTENTGVMTFNSNGGSAVASQTINYWSKPTKPADPTKEGFTFGGWYTSQEFTTEFDFTAPIKTGKTAFAKWTENDASLVFVPNGGSSVVTQNLKYWTNTTEPDEPIYEGFTFGGWYTDDGTFNNKFVFGEPIKLGGTVYAKWTEDPSKIIYVTNGGSEVPTENLTYWEKPSRPTDPTKEGFTFKGWFKTNDFDEEFDFTQPVKTGAKAYAKWEENSSVITFESGEGSPVEDQTVLYWSKPTVPEEPTREGYTFDGWYTTEDFDELFDFEKEMKGRTVTVYANWLRISIVKFETNGGSEVEEQKVLYGDLVVKPEDPSKYDHNFIGWYKDESLTEAFDFETEILNGKDIILYAKWRQIEHPEPEPDPTVEPTVEPTVGPTPTPTPSVTPTVKPTETPVPSEKPGRNTENESEERSKSEIGHNPDSTPLIRPSAEPTVEPTTEVVENKVMKDSLIIKVKNLFKAILNIFKHVGWYWWIIIVIILIVFVIRQIKKKISKEKAKRTIDKNNEINAKEDDE